MRARAADALEVLALTAACLTLAWGPLAQGSAFGWGQAGLTLLGALTLAATLLALGVRGRAHIPHPLWLLAALSLLAWVWASVSWAPYTVAALRWAGSWTAVLGTAISLHLLCRTSRRQLTALAVLVATGAGALLLAALQTRGVFMPGFTHYPGVGLTLVTGPYFNPSHFSGFLIPVAAITSGLLLFTRPHLHTLALVALLIALHALNFRTDSSSIPAVLLATALPALVWVWTKWPKVGAALTGLAALAVLGGAAFFLTPAGQRAFAEHQRSIGISRNWTAFLREREAVWRYGRDMWADHPLTGAGVGQFATESALYRAPERQVGARMDAKSVNYAHNDALQVASELGAVGLLAFLALLLLPLTRSGGTAALICWGALPALLFAGVYDAHLTAIPGTATVALALMALGAAARRPQPERADARHAARQVLPAAPDAASLRPDLP